MFYPALEVDGVDSELVAALVDDFSPTAAEPLGARTVVYFADAASRDLAAQAIAGAFPSATLISREVDDEDWARRSQENLTPITVGRITVTPPWHAGNEGRDSRLGVREAASTHSNLGPRNSNLEKIQIVIAPSMGFGTGHHVTTRLCLAALQALDLRGARVLDVGTGSGVLAIAARALGAVEAIGIDYDADAIQSARENLDANPAITGVQLVVGDLRDTPMMPADVVIANLTGALLVQSAGLLLGATRPGGTLILSGLLAPERDAVVQAFSPQGAITAEAVEDGWVGLTVNRIAG